MKIAFLSIGFAKCVLLNVQKMIYVITQNTFYEIVYIFSIFHLTKRIRSLSNHSNHHVICYLFDVRITCVWHASCRQIRTLLCLFLRGLWWWQSHKIHDMNNHKSESTLVVASSIKAFGVV